MVSNIHHIINIRDEAQLLQEFLEFEQALNNTIAPLRALLAVEMLSSEYAQLEQHLARVEPWRDRVCRFYALATCFAEHAKAHYFLLAKGKGVTGEDRTAYQKHLTAGMLACQADMEDLIRSVDSRVNHMKKRMGFESDSGGRRAAARS